MTWSRVKPRSQVHGWDHAKARKAWAARHQPTDPCVRCDHPLGPMGSWLHLDHDDVDKTLYRGFAHGSRPCAQCGRRCNLTAAGNLGRARQKAQRIGQYVVTGQSSSRKW